MAINMQIIMTMPATLYLKYYWKWR